MLSTLFRKPPKKMPHELGRPARLISFSIIIFLLSQLAAAFAVELMIAITHPGAPLSFFDQSIAAQFFFVLLAEGLAAYLAIRLVHRRKLHLGVIGLGRYPRWKDAGYAILGIGVFYVFIIVAGLILTVFVPHFNVNQQQNLGFDTINTATDNILAFLALVVLPPLGEEPLVRGYLFSGLRAHWRFLPAMLVTSLLFGIAHLEIGSGSPLVWGAAIDTFLLSVVLVYLRERTGALYAGILVHMLNNLVAFSVHFHL